MSLDRKNEINLGFIILTFFFFGLFYCFSSLSICFLEKPPGLVNAMFALKFYKPDFKLSLKITLLVFYSG